MPIKEMNIEQLEARKAEIKGLIADADADTLKDLEKEVNEIAERMNELKSAAEKRQAIRDRVASMTGGIPIVKKEGYGPKDRDAVLSSAEYRDAWLKKIGNRALTEAEERILTTGITGNEAGIGTDASKQSLLIPTEIHDEIVDLISGDHPLYADVFKLNSGIAVTIPKNTEGSGATFVAENTAAAEEELKFVGVTLAGKDITKWIDISYAMAKMSLPALKAYLEKEIANKMGEGITDDIIKTISKDLEAKEGLYNAKENIIETNTIDYATLVSGFGTLKRVKNVSIYANRKTFFNKIIGLTGEDGHPIFQLDPTGNAAGMVLGGKVKLEDGMADDEILIGDADRYTMNVIQDIMIETDRDIKYHKITYSGYAREEGTLVDKKAFALIKPQGE